MLETREKEREAPYMVSSQERRCAAGSWAVRASVLRPEAGAALLRGFWWADADAPPESLFVTTASPGTERVRIGRRLSRSGTQREFRGWGSQGTLPQASKCHKLQASKLSTCPQHKENWFPLCKQI
ncbi:hypothetical protein CDV36_011382 [Fusarium kuroshium]|uniref:Uncharacterized protein n=2 Tax=Fusarium solani species complex TaxID=232080 RepID=A0A3M2RV03_9HYPO|nr:hypothetical protein CDV36_011382 [Fusarium kuroshium]RSL60973.1 hypothetical protein CEP51_013684 [Fusarium floridanum]